MKSGDKATYAGDVHPNYTGREAVAKEFDLEGGMILLKFQDGMCLWVFADEIMIPG